MTVSQASTTFQSLFRPGRHGDERVAKRVQLRVSGSEVLRRLKQGLWPRRGGRGGASTRESSTLSRGSPPASCRQTSLSFDQWLPLKEIPCDLLRLRFLPAATACCDRSADRPGTGRTSRPAGCGPIPPFRRHPSIGPGFVFVIFRRDGLHLLGEREVTKEFNSGWSRLKSPLTRGWTPSGSPRLASRNERPFRAFLVQGLLVPLPSKSSLAQSIRDKPPEKRSDPSLRSPNKPK